MPYKGKTSLRTLTELQFYCQAQEGMARTMLARFCTLKLGSVARMRPLMAENSAQSSQPSLENAHTVLLRACVRARRKLPLCVAF